MGGRRSVCRRLSGTDATVLAALTLLEATLEALAATPPAA